MKFAKDLERDLVPEWRMKYLDYKQGKKRVKAVGRAASRMSTSTPRTPAQPNQGIGKRTTYGTTSPSIFRSRTLSVVRNDNRRREEPTASLRDSPAPFGSNSRPESDSSVVNAPKDLKRTPPIPMSTKNKARESAPLDSVYGSFIRTPPLSTDRFELPGPAVSPLTPLGGNYAFKTAHDPHMVERPEVRRSASIAVPPSAYEIGETTSPHRSAFKSLRNHFPNNDSVRPFIRRMFSAGGPAPLNESTPLDVNMIAVDQVRTKTKNFFKWMDKEFDKVEGFYITKEDEAGARLKILREQLHEMRNRRIEELSDGRRAKAMGRDEDRSLFDFYTTRANGQSKKDDNVGRPNSREHLQGWRNPLERVIGETKAKMIGPGSNSKALQSMTPSPQIHPGNSRVGDPGQDYVRRHDNDVPYRSAKRKLKLALQEFYRGMELLKSFSLLNRTAFRKINKKYDKAVGANPPLRYMSEKVNKARFVQSDVLDGHMHAVEDLYARYFERGNTKIATGKLRGGRNKTTDQSASAFRNGILIGVGTVFSIQGVIYASSLLKHANPTVRLQTSYLLQIYGGYFLALYLFFWFCLACSIWTKNKINYQFVFEFDTRHNLDWRELSEFPSILILLFGLFVWLNFSRYGAPEMFIYYPVILIFVTILLIFIPAPIIFYRSRRWFVYSHWRLLLAGLYPVEFRDFFLGDMFCSLTYLMSNIELFFCLYAHYWNNPSQCNSTHSRLLGFFSTLPGIWRALQCIRRYFDTRNVFPHLVNCGKYGMTILAGVTLSLYRIDRTNNMLALFTTFATVNSIYCIIWDLLMDWSLLQTDAKKRFLRDVRGYKNPKWYYLAMILDPILRFNWIFYSIYTHDLQHSTIASFLVGFSEVTRRGIWTIFRVENEHCSNVARFKASRDVPLPYDIEASSEGFMAETHQEQQNPAIEAITSTPTATGLPPFTKQHSRASGGEHHQQTPDSEFRRRAPTRTFTKLIADAHTQDFEKKRKPGAADSDKMANVNKSIEDDEDVVGSSSDDEDSDDQDVDNWADDNDHENRSGN